MLATAPDEDPLLLIIFRYLLRAILALMTSILYLIHYLLLPITLPLFYIFRTTVILPVKLAYAILSMLTPLFVLLGSCALIGGVVGGGAAVVLKVGGWFVTNGGESQRWVEQPLGSKKKKTTKTGVDS